MAGITEYLKSLSVFVLQGVIIGLLFLALLSGFQFIYIQLFIILAVIYMILALVFNYNSGNNNGGEN